MAFPLPENLFVLCNQIYLGKVFAPCFSIGIRARSLNFIAVIVISSWIWLCTHTHIEGIWGIDILVRFLQEFKYFSFYCWHTNTGSGWQDGWVGWGGSGCVCAGRTRTSWAQGCSGKQHLSMLAIFHSGMVRCHWMPSVYGSVPGQRTRGPQKASQILPVQLRTEKGTPNVSLKRQLPRYTFDFLGQFVYYVFI